MVCLYLKVITVYPMFTEEYRVYTKKNAFSCQIYENKGSVLEIPS